LLPEISPPGSWTCSVTCCCIGCNFALERSQATLVQLVVAKVSTPENSFFSSSTVPIPLAVAVAQFCACLVLTPTGQRSTSSSQSTGTRRSACVLPLNGGCQTDAIPSSSTPFIRSTWNQHGNCDPIFAILRHRANQLCVFSLCPSTHLPVGVRIQKLVAHL
jgi:hypothetical protein